MPFKDKETRRAHYQANKERINARRRASNEANKDKIAAQRKARYEANKERIAERDKARYEANKEKLAAQKKEYCKTEAGLKTQKMKNWRKNGVNNVTDELYDYFMSCDKCEACGKEFTDTYNKCLDHDHDTGDFRYILCRGCNTHDRWKKHITTI